MSCGWSAKRIPFRIGFSRSKFRVQLMANVSWCQLSRLPLHTTDSRELLFPVWKVTCAHREPKWSVAILQSLQMEFLLLPSSTSLLHAPSFRSKRGWGQGWKTWDVRVKLRSSLELNPIPECWTRAGHKLACSPETWVFPTAVAPHIELATPTIKLIPHKRRAAIYLIYNYFLRIHVH